MAEGVEAFSAPVDQKALVEQVDRALEPGPATSRPRTGQLRYLAGSCRAPRHRGSHDLLRMPERSGPEGLAGAIRFAPSPLRPSL